MIAPITFLLADALDIEAIPLLIIEVMASNIGGTATLIGDPPNIIIAGATGLSFNAFIVNLAPIVLRHFGRRHRRFSTSVSQAARRSRSGPARRSWSSTRRPRSATPPSCGGPVPVLLLTVLAFFAHQALHVEPATVALTGAAIGLLVTRVDLEKALSGIEWTTLFFFIGLFVMVGALEATGAIEHVTEVVKDVTGGDRTAELIGITWVAAAGSAVVDNIPFTTAMIPVVRELQESSGNGGDDAYWWALALGACFGGNATMIAAAANVAAAGWRNGRARRSASWRSSASAFR